MAAKPRKPSPRKPKAELLPPEKARKKHTGGKPEFQPTDQQRAAVEAMVAVGITQEDIGLVIGIAPVTLRRHFERELAVGAIKANAQVGGALFKKATGAGPQSVAAGIWWSKTRMGWKETTITEHRGRIESVSRNMTAREAAEAYANTRRRPKAA